MDAEIVTTYAQYNEDLILWALLGGVKKGLYVDVGANYPTIDSVTKLFYENGWRGMNIEPLQSLYEQLKKERPLDNNLHFGISDKAGELDFREYVDVPGHSTFDKAQKKQENNPTYLDYKVKVKTLADVFREANVKSIDFLKIDVEGYEYQVIKGGDWAAYRPKVICIEANHVIKDWRPILASSDYKLFISDGLNEYYVAKEHWGLTDNFAEKAVLVSHRSLKQHYYDSWKADIAERSRLTSVSSIQAEHIQELETLIKNLEDIAALSLRKQPYRTRIKRAVYGLTVDWLSSRKK